jgi:hypothetical protein
MHWRHRVETRAGFSRHRLNCHEVRGLATDHGTGSLRRGLSALVTRSPIRVLLSVACFFAAFAAVCAGVRKSQAFPEVVGIYPKWLYFGKNKDRYDVLFLGSSRFYHQIIPLQFDQRVVAARGGDKGVRSFNFGYDAMWPPESFYMMRRILELKPARLKWVFIDTLGMVANLEAENRDTQRTAYWHDWQHTRIAWEGVMDMPSPPVRKWRLLAGHGSLFVRQMTNQGRGAEWLNYAMGVEKRKKASRWALPKVWAATEGYAAEPSVAFSGKALERYEEKVEEMREGIPEVPARPSFRRALDDIVREVKAAGMEPILILPPSVDFRENFTGLPEGVPTWRYNDPVSFTELYETANRFDDAHLNHSGAMIFTDLLAAKFVEYLDSANIQALPGN